MNWNFVLTLSLVLASSSACGEWAPEPAPHGSQASPAIQRIDSAGTELIRNLDAVVDTQAFELVPVLRIGRVDGPEEELFHQVTGVATDQEGRIFVTDQGTRSVRLFDAEGRFVRAFGGPGRGPGEFSSIGSVVRWRDSLHVVDHVGRYGRGHFYDTTGALLGGYAGLLPEGAGLLLLAGGPDGWFVQFDSLFARQPVLTPGGVTRDAWLTARLDPSRLAEAMTSVEAAGVLLIPIAWQQGRRTFLTVSESGQCCLGNPPFFEPIPSRAVDGRGLVYVAEGWRYGIDVYDAHGRLVRRISRAHEAVPVTDEIIAEMLRRVRAHYDTVGGAGGGNARFYEARATLPRVGSVPVVGALHASEEGWLWVLRPDLTPDPVALVWSGGLPPRPGYWDVFDPDGGFAHSVRVAPEVTVRLVTADGFIGVERDALGVQSVVRYRVQAVTSPGG